MFHESRDRTLGSRPVPRHWKARTTVQTTVADHNQRLHRLSSMITALSPVAQTSQRHLAGKSALVKVTSPQDDSFCEGREEPSVIPVSYKL